MVARIADRIEKIRETINAAASRANRGDTERIKLIVVTKSATIEQIHEVIRQGLVELGENRVQQIKKVWMQVNEYLKENAAGSPPKTVSWHMIGHLQRNKVRHVLALVSVIHSVDTLRLAEEINSLAAKMGFNAKVLLQVNTSQEPQKYGVPVGAAVHLAEQVKTLSNIELIGLMTMAPLTHNKDVIRGCFWRARELFWKMKGEKIVGPEFTELSMGMSSDYEIAVEEGATMLRIGSAIFAG